MGYILTHMNIKQYLWVAKINAALSMSSPLLVIFNKFIWKLLEAKKSLFTEITFTYFTYSSFSGQNVHKKIRKPKNNTGDRGPDDH